MVFDVGTKIALANKTHNCVNIQFQVQIKFDCFTLFI